jgi:hypothetical protein
MNIRRQNGQGLYVLRVSRPLESPLFENLSTHLKDWAKASHLRLDQTSQIDVDRTYFDESSSVDVSPHSVITEDGIVMRPVLTQRNYDVYKTREKLDFSIHIFGYRSLIGSAYNKLFASDNLAPILEKNPSQYVDSASLWFCHSGTQPMSQGNIESPSRNSFEKYLRMQNG